MRLTVLFACRSQELGSIADTTGVLPGGRRDGFSPCLGELGILGKSA